MAEVAGLALAVLPLLISAAQYYQGGIDSLQTLGSKTGDDRMLEFYEEIAFEIFMLRNCIKKLVKDLPGFTVEYKRGLLCAAGPEIWSDEALAESLKLKLGEDTYDAFERTLRRVLKS